LDLIPLKHAAGKVANVELY